MRRFHLIFGILVFIVFLLTGQYMDKFHNHLEGMDDKIRLLYRTRHIFILMAGLIHILLGLYYRNHIGRWQRPAQIAGSLALTAGTLLVIGAFIYEPGIVDWKTPFTHWGMYLLVLGTILHGGSAANVKG